MRILVLDEWLPVPADSGKRLRSFELLRRLTGRHEITWLAPVEPAEGSDEARRLMEAEGFRVETLPEHLPGRSEPGFYLRALASLASPLPYVVLRHRSAALEQAILALHRRQPFDLLHVEWTPLAANRPSGWDRPCVVVAHNLESRIWERLATVSRRLHERAFFAYESKRMRKYERAVFQRAQAVIGVSEDECEEIRGLGGRAWCVENGVDLERLKPGPRCETGSLLFTGALDWQANQDAVEHFVRDLWPGVRAACPRLRFVVVGRRPPEDWKRRIGAVDGVEIHASVPDVRPYLEAAAVVVVPLRVGGGTRLKILEALAMEKAVVSTRIGAEGLHIEPGRDLLLAETPAEWAGAVRELMEDPVRRAEMGASGRLSIQGRYGWQTLSGRLERVWLALAARESAA